MKFFLVTVGSKTYPEIDPLTFAQKYENDIDEGQLKKGIESAFKKAFRKAGIEVKSLQPLNVADYVHMENTTLSTVGMILDSKIEKVKRLRRKAFWDSIFGFFA